MANEELEEAPQAKNPPDGDDYLPIEQYGVIGDLYTTALVGLNGSIDFFCFPSFDSPSVFCRLLDARKGGHFSIAPHLCKAKQRQLYLPDTNVLVTRSLSEDGIVEITDCMPVGQEGPGQQIIRIVKVIRGEVAIRMECAPRFDYGRSGHTITVDPETKHLHIQPEAGGQPALRLYSEIPLTIDGDDITAEFTLKAGEHAHFHLVWAEEIEPHTTGDVDAVLEQTIDFWRRWTSLSNYKGRWREMVMRSALVLKLLTCHSSGGLVAAPTFGLPEAIGGSRNWDYRYCWIRDSAFAVYALIRLGFKTEAADYMKWIEQRFKQSKDGSLNLMYRVSGATDLEEQSLDHWEGYHGSRPVRIGNGASGQTQLDIYGELLDSVYLIDKHVTGLSHDGWIALAKTVNYVCDHWREPDHGIWEVRGGKQEFLHSRLMCWVAIDRAIRLARNESLPAEFQKWDAERTKIYHSIFDDFWNDELQSFVQYKGGSNVDASTLMMPMVKFIAPTDPRWLSTLELIGQRLGTDALIERYRAESIDFEGIDQSTEGSFTMCSFWYIECLARAGQVDKAQLLFEKMLGYANHLGLYSEELGMDGSHLGNFPQAFTHLALISAAYALNLKLGGDGNYAWRF